MSQHTWEYRAELVNIGHEPMGRLFAKGEVTSPDPDKATQVVKEAASRWVRKRELLGDLGYGPTCVGLFWVVKCTDPGCEEQRGGRLKVWIGDGNREAMRAAGLPEECNHRWMIIDSRDISRVRKLYIYKCRGCGGMREETWWDGVSRDPKVRYEMPVSRGDNQ